MDSRDSSDQDDEHIVQVRQALMCPDGGRFEGLRTAHFLNYTTTSIEDDVFELPLDAFITSEPEKLSFSGWGSPSVDWIEWVNTMAETNALVWRKSGVYDAIMASRYQITKQDDLMTALVEKWCIETNSFVFPWGEATVTLEDMIVLGGFSAIGNNVLASVKRDSMKGVEEKLKRAKREIEAASSMKRCCVGLWMKEMMNSGNEIEHEAFMVTWLSRFVFPNSGDYVREKLFAAAVQLARGVRLALAPAVLAGIYSSLGVLKKQLVGDSREEEMGPILNIGVTATSPFQFVQVWAWERIMDVRPPGQPSQLKPHEPRMALWHQHGGGQELNQSQESIRTVLDSAKESFHYRPYTKPLKNFKFPKFYLEDDCWVSLEDEDIVAFGRCLRCSKLVGLNCIEPYYPHRVALQFGYDQDVPGVVPVVLTESPELAWKDYIRPITDEMMYIPCRLRQGDVTVKYVRWWKQSVTTLQALAKRSTHKVLKEKPAETKTTTIAMVKSSPPRTSKTVGSKAELKVGNVKTVSDKSNGSSSVKSVTGSEKTKAKKPLYKFTKTPGRTVDEVKEGKGGPKSSQEIKSHSHVIKPKALPVKSPRPQTSKGPKDSSSASVSPSLTSKNPPKRTPKAITSHQSSPSKATPALKRNVADQRIKAHTKQETRLSSKGGSETMMNTLKAMSEIMNLEEHVGEGGEVMYQIPKQQFEVLSQGVQDVLHELQSIKSALNINKSSSL